MRSVHEGIVTWVDCPYCDEAVTNNNVMVRKHFCLKHPTEHLKDKPKFCSICYHNFVNQEELNGHMDGSHDDVKCPTCGKYCHNVASLKIHVRVHTGERPFECPLCDLKFKTKGNLKVEYFLYKAI